MRVMLLSAFCWTCLASLASPCEPQVGYRVMTLSGVTTGVWYPTSSQESKYAYAKDRSGMVALNGALADCGPVPLIVFSHGFGGCGIQTLFLTEELARDGYIVAAPDHADALCSVDGRGELHSLKQEASFFDPEKWTSRTYVERGTDVEHVINAILSSPVFAGHVQSNRIGLAGHSLGGYIAVGLAGGWAEWKDSRIRAVLAMSPYVLPFMNRLSSLEVPVMYQGAEFDLGITPFLEGDQGAFARTGGPKYFVKLRGGTHFEWTNLLCGTDHTVSGCLEAKPNARIIDDYALAFFDWYLKANREPLLTKKALGVAAFEYRQ
jgi:predicted dienelactone hydrolase